MANLSAAAPIGQRIIAGLYPIGPIHVQAMCSMANNREQTCQGRLHMNCVDHVNSLVPEKHLPRLSLVLPTTRTFDRSQTKAYHPTQ